MFVSSREAMVDAFGSSATSDGQKGSRARFRLNLETAVGAACLAAAFFVPDGYPRLVAFSMVSLCAYAWILRACQRD